MPYFTRRRGLGYTPGAGLLYGCSVQTVNACGFWDYFGTPSIACQNGLDACIAQKKAATASPAAGSTMTPGANPGAVPGAMVLTQSGVGVQVNPACANADDPVSCTAALALQASSDAQINALKAANAGVINSNPCPYETNDAGGCCVSGQVIDDNGNCANPPASIPTWGWIALAAFGAILVVKAI